MLLLGVLIYTLVKGNKINTLTIFYQIRKITLLVITPPEHQEQLDKTGHGGTSRSGNPSSPPWKNTWEQSGGDLALERSPSKHPAPSRRRGAKTTQTHKSGTNLNGQAPRPRISSWPYLHTPTDSHLKLYHCSGEGYVKTSSRWGRKHIPRYLTNKPFF